MQHTSFWESNFLIALITLIVGLVALYIYWKQKIDKKKDAASIVLLEIKHAESRLSEAKETIEKNGVVPETIFALKSSNWNKYSYLFVRDFTDEEWNLIDEFYEKAARYDEIVQYNNTFFRKNEEQIRINLHSALSGYIKDYLADIQKVAEENGAQTEQTAKAKKKYEELQEVLKGFSDNFLANVFTPGTSFFYTPQKTLTDAQAVLNNIRIDLSVSTIGIKLNEIVNQTIRSRIATRLLGIKTNKA